LLGKYMERSRKDTTTKVQE
jgi:hypothetical protein